MSNNILEKIKKQILDSANNYTIHSLKEKKFVPGVTDVPVSGKVIASKEIQNMIEASLDGWLTTGRFNKEFEKRLANFIGTKFLLTINSGSSANLVAFSTLTSPKLKDRAIKEGDEVIAVAAGFPTTVNPIMQNKCVPVFVDVKIPTYNVDEDKIESAITKKTKAIMIAHTLGNPFNLKKIKEICQKYNLWLVEDSCDGLGSKYDNKNVGTFGDMATLSFYPAHHITMGEGGAIFTNSIKLKRIADSFRDWGRDCYCEPGQDNTCNKRFSWKLGDLPFGYDHKYTYSHMGYNLKITDMQAACGLGQLDQLESFIKKRKENFNFLFKKLKELEEFIILPVAEINSDPSWFGFPISLRKSNKFNRNDLIRYLTESKIGTRLVFAGNLTKQPYMKKLNYKVHGDLVNTDFVMENTFWVGVFPGLSAIHMNYIADKLKIFFYK